MSSLPCSAASIRLPYSVSCRRNAARLKDYLKDYGVDMGWVQPAVVWAGETLTVDNPAVPVWTLQQLPDHIEEIWQSRSLSEEIVQKAMEVLNKAVEEASG